MADKRMANFEFVDINHIARFYYPQMTYRSQHRIRANPFSKASKKRVSHFRGHMDLQASA